MSDLSKGRGVRNVKRQPLPDLPDLGEDRRHERIRKKKRKRRKRALIRITIASILLAVMALIGLVLHFRGNVGILSPKKKIVAERPPIDVELLTINPYSRPGIANDGVKAVVVHYTANPGTDALQNRNYFESLKDTEETYASSQFVIGQDGSIVQCVPTAEIAYASNDRNHDTVSIECCYNNEDGSFEDATYDSLVYLLAWLSGRFDLDPETDIIRHYDVTGKLCPLYYVENEDAWDKLKDDVADYIEKNGSYVDPEEVREE